MTAPHTGAIIIRFPWERRSPLTLDGVYSVLSSYDALHHWAEFREVPGPRDEAVLQAQGSARMQPIMAKAEQQAPFMTPQALLYDVQKRSLARALKLIARANRFKERAEDREVEDPDGPRIYEDLADSHRACIVAWEKAHILIGLWRALAVFDRVYFQAVSA